jgi:pyrroline-5-carboxylate reductase
LKIGLIGGGAMGEAIIAAVTKAGVATAGDIRVADIAAQRVSYLGSTYGVQGAKNNTDAAQGSDCIILAIKPQDFDKAAPSIRDGIGGATAVSIMAGVPLKSIGDGLGTSAVVRAMPNTPAQIGEGMTVWTATPEVAQDARAGVAQIFGALGKEAYVPEERYLDMATALSGSGPAYVFLFIEALIDAGVHVGLSRELATTMAIQTVLGSAKYAESTGRHPAELRNQVTSPGGTTAAALRSLEAGGFRGDILEAVVAAYERSRALGGGGGDSK